MDFKDACRVTPARTRRYASRGPGHRCNNANQRPPSPARSEPPTTPESCQGRCGPCAVPGVGGRGQGRGVTSAWETPRPSEAQSRVWSEECQGQVLGCGSHPGQRELPGAEPAGNSRHRTHAWMHPQPRPKAGRGPPAGPATAAKTPPLPGRRLAVWLNLHVHSCTTEHPSPQGPCGPVTSLRPST